MQSLELSLDRSLGLDLLDLRGPRKEHELRASATGNKGGRKRVTRKYTLELLAFGQLVLEVVDGLELYKKRSYECHGLEARCARQ